MQWILNFLFNLLSSIFSFLGSLTAPVWFHDVILSIAKYVTIANYYFPIDTLCVVALSVVSISGVLMIISFFLQIL